MRSARSILVVAIFAIAVPSVSVRAEQITTHATPATTLLYLDRSGWELASREERIALAADFMRVFCGNPAMPAADLVRCLDHAGDAGSIFERAMACVAGVAAGPTR